VAVIYLSIAWRDLVKSRKSLGTFMLGYERLRSGSDMFQSTARRDLVKSRKPLGIWQVHHLPGGAWQSHVKH